jgi:hypothetical protein
MLCQSAQDRPDSIEQIKMQLIGRKNEFITRQRLSELKETVVPITELEDELISDPIRIIDFDWNKNQLTLIFQRPVNQKWIEALRNMGNYESVVGKGPEAFGFDNNKAIISAREEEIQLIINFFSQWIPKANAVYKRNMQRLKEEEENRQRKELERQIQEQETRQRVLKNIKLPNS